MKRNARLAATDPDTLTSLLRPHVADGTATVAQREYVAHHDGCPQCHAATDTAKMCSLGRHLFNKLTRGDDE